MPLQIEVSKIAAPGLEFGSPGAFVDPKIGLERAGPFDLRFGSAHKSQLRVGMVGTMESIGKCRTWLTRCKFEIPSEGVETPLRRSFPGFQKAFHCELQINERWNAVIKSDVLSACLSKPERERFESVLNIVFSAPVPVDVLT